MTPARALILAAMLIWPSASSGSTPAPALVEAGGRPAGYTLVWADEFDRDGLPDPARWTYDTERNAQGWWNGEAQYYSHARLENSRVENGVLILEAHKERMPGPAYSDWGGQEYSSARLITNGRAAWTYGFIEVRAKLPCGRGSWPAIWMLAAPPNDAWPQDGEIDIMEHVGYDAGIVHGTVHTSAYNHQRRTHRGARTEIADACEAFHRYQLTWTPERIIVGVDDRNFFQFNNDGRDDRATWPFNAPQYLLLNIAVGGGWGGNHGIDDAMFPIRMEVDYVRVYQAPAG